MTAVPPASGALHRLLFMMMTAWVRIKKTVSSADKFTQDKIKP